MATRSERCGDRSRVFEGDVEVKGKKRFSGIVKLFKGLELPAKEARILMRFEEAMPDLPMARVAEYREVSGGEFDEEGWKFLLAESMVEGPMVVDEVSPGPLADTQRNAAILFDQLAFVSEDEKLVREGLGFCGNISSLNVRHAPGGYVIVDWSAVNEGQTFCLSPRYIPPEITNGGEIYEVNADTYALGCLLARVLLGRDKFRQLFPDDGEKTYLRSEDVMGLVPEQTREFFKITLATDPLERVVEGATDPAENYKRLKQMFCGEITQL